MAVVIETTLGDITIDLYTKERPRACMNFLKLCKIKYYNYNLFHTVSRDFIAQTGDPTGSRTGGESIFGVLGGPLKRYFESETQPLIKHTVTGLVSFVGAEEAMIGSQFFITLASDLTYLDDHHCVFGEVAEGLDVLELLNDAICDADNRPYQDIRITHTVILDDPYPDLDGLRIPSRSPSPSAERLQGGRIAPDEEIDETVGRDVHEIEEIMAQREAKARATILEMVGDIPDAEMAPPENVLFVCKLNPVTTDDDLEIIFSRFGKINSCEVIRDKKTGDSLQYAFIEFDEKKSCEDAYFKMDNVLIDDRRIHVDFSQSVAKVKWLGKGRGVAHFDDKGRKTDDKKNDLGQGNYKRSKNLDQGSKSRGRSPKNREKSPESRGRFSRDKERSSKERRRSPKSRESHDVLKRVRNRSPSSKSRRYLEDRRNKGRFRPYPPASKRQQWRHRSEERREDYRSERTRDWKRHGDDSGSRESQSRRFETESGEKRKSRNSTARKPSDRRKSSPSSSEYESTSQADKIKLAKSRKKCKRNSTSSDSESGRKTVPNRSTSTKQKHKKKSENRSSSSSDSDSFEEKKRVKTSKKKRKKYDNSSDS